MQSVEPMMMGSPVGSPSSPGIHGTSTLNQSQFLPAYLMGEPSPMSSPRMWSSSATTSPSKALNRSLSMSGMPQSAFSPAPRQDQSLHRPREMLSSRGKDKSGAPPICGLLTSPPAASDVTSDLNRSRTANLFSSSFIGTPTQPGITDLHSTSCYSPAPVNTSSLGGYSQTKKTPPSPAQIDPFYTQGETIGPDDVLDDTWITIFGFPAAATSFILQQFSQYGNILKHVVATDGNWLHLKYQSRLQAKKALSKNGKVFGSSIMVGVTTCIDKNVMEGEKENSVQQSLSSVTGPLTPSSVPTGNIGSASRYTSIRPLTAAYKAASSENEVVHKSNTPQKNTGVVSKAMEYMFGW